MKKKGFYMKKVFILALALPFSIHAKAPEQTTETITPVIITQTNKSPQWKEFRDTLLTSMIPGTLIGSLSGYGCYQIEEHVIKNRGNMTAGRVLNWIGFSLARSAVVSTVSKTMSEHDIKHSPAIMQTTAWIVDWLIFLYKIR